MSLQKIASILTLCLVTVAGTAQTAPDFSVTDSWGTTHKLYEDYLDQGKTVMLKLFYVNCPPCNAISPFLEPLYQTWGGGDADVQFIELSILQSDTDVKVNGYKELHHTTYPAAGGEGGSVAAAAPYKSGMFGPYSGTPTFVIIAPDGSVNYDVSGNNIPATIEALDAAIAATGATGNTTATNELRGELGVQLVSNLVTNELTLQNLSENSTYEITLVDMMGISWLQHEWNAQDGETSVMNIDPLSPGAWICLVRDTQSDRFASKLFFKQ